MNKNKTMMLIFVASEAFFFIGLLIAFIFYSRPGGVLSSTAQYLEINKTAIFTLFLLASSLTLEVAAHGLKRGKRGFCLGALISTIALGAVFICGQGLEYYRLAKVNVTVSQNVFGTAFFTLTGFHGLHVIIGLVVMAMLTGMIASGKYRKVEKTVIEGTTIYWHFVDAVWVVVFSVVYLGVLL